MSNPRQFLVELDIEAQRLAEYISSNKNSLQKIDPENILDLLDYEESVHEEEMQKLVGKIRNKLLRLHPQFDQFFIGVTLALLAFRHLTKTEQQRFFEAEQANGISGVMFEGHNLTKEERAHCKLALRRLDTELKDMNFITSLDEHQNNFCFTAVKT
jgi:hypothetical protein